MVSEHGFGNCSKCGKSPSFGNESAAFCQCKKDLMVGELAELSKRLFMAQVASCSCGTKTHEHRYHEKNCLYRILDDAKNTIEGQARQIENARKRFELIVGQCEAQGDSIGRMSKEKEELVGALEALVAKNADYFEGEYDRPLWEVIIDARTIIAKYKKGEGCSACADSDRPGFIVVSEYHDRMVPTDVVGEHKLTSGKEYMRCMECNGTALKGKSDE
ncbi:MAG: hypothetical protein KAJ19_02945 [Gammaproteobacteria bacterium]|nr:hypothetical protein [Gammaproteobacteria bacterium]